MKTAIALLILGSLSAHAALPYQTVLAQAAKDYGLDCNGTDLEGRMEPKDRVETATITLKVENVGLVNTTYHTVTCSLAAYNSDGVVYVEVAEGSKVALRQVHMTSVKVGARGAVKGYYSTATAGAPSIDATKGTLNTFYKGRGVGDAFEAATYKLEQENAVLVKYQIDNTFDGKINPKTLVNIK